MQNIFLNVVFALSIMALSNFCASTTLAQDKNIEGSLTAYVWVPETTIGVDTPWGHAHSTLTRSEAIKSLDFAYMMTGKLYINDWILLGDLIYLDVSGKSNATLYGLFSGINAQSNLTILSSYALYDFLDDNNLSLALGAGVRAGWTELNITLKPGLIREFKVRINDSWVDPVLIARVQYDMTPDFYLTLLMDYANWGGGAMSENTWQGLASLSYDFADNWTMSVAYRHLEIDQKRGNIMYDMEMSGPVAGVSYRF
jgi:opacity protein-like surface antigen